MERSVRSETALTLAETIIASCLLGLVVLAIFNLLPASLMTMRQAEHQIRADQIAQEALEIHRQLPYENLAVGMPATQPAPVTEAGVTFRPALEIYQVPSTNVDRILRIRVVVEWRFRGLTKRVSQETYRANVRRP